MITPNFIIDSSSINAVKAKVEIYNDSTLVTTCTCSDYLQGFSVSRIGDNGKFFGFGICQGLKITLIDLERSLDITKGMRIKVAYGDGINFVYPHPDFYVEEAIRDEETNAIEVTAYDILYNAKDILFNNTEIPYDYDAKNPDYLAYRCLKALSRGRAVDVIEDYLSYLPEFNIEPNFDGTETVADVLRLCAEVKQAIYYIASNEYDDTQYLYIKRLDVNNDAVLTITRNDYLTLKTGAEVVLSDIAHITEYGENVGYTDDKSGVVQYVHENAIWEKAEDISHFLFNAWCAMEGARMHQFTCENWLGNYLLEVGDKISFETDDGNYITSYLLDDVISFDGTLSQTTRYAYEPDTDEVFYNPSDIGEAIKKTYVRVDKVNKEITASVENVQTNLDNAMAGVNGEIGTLTERVNATMTATEIQLQISSTLQEEGAAKVETSTGYTLNEDGLHISKSGSGVENLIDNTGMYVKRDGTDILVANTDGVEATNLYAKTYLVIGENSRFEDYYNNGNRTGCFFIGG